MTQLSNDCFAHDGRLLLLSEAEAILRARARPTVPIETVPLLQACGHILAQPILATRNVPPFDNSAVDGYAVHGSDLVDKDRTICLPIAEGRAAAGHPFPRPAPAGQAYRILTGARIPSAPEGGPDTVFMQEDCRVSEDGRTILLPPGLRHGANLRKCGEDIATGTLAIESGLRLRPQEISLAAALGCTEIKIYGRLRIGVFSTGDELREPGENLQEGQIYDANRYGLLALFEKLGFATLDLGILPDDPQAIGAAFDRALADGAHALAGSAGMSVGEEDHVRTAIKARGHMHFWRLAIKPGRPVAFGQIGDVPIIGLPGNPAAMMATALRIARPLLLRLAGIADGRDELTPCSYRVRALFAHRKKPARREWIRARVRHGKDGILEAERFAREGAGLLSSLVFANGLVELPEEQTQLNQGDPVDFLPFSEMLS